jgi:thiol-disulfide isomerase/thioredoxin
MTKNKLFILLAGFVALTAGFFVQHLSDMKHSPAVLEFSLPDLAGKQRNINEWKNKLLIINFWATWCPPCLKEIPAFIKLQSQFNDTELQFIGIAIDEKDAVSEYLETININYPILIGGDTAIALSRQLGNILNAVPYTLIINQQGQIIHRQPGEISRDEILEIILPIIKTDSKTL